MGDWRARGCPSSPAGSRESQGGCCACAARSGALLGSSAPAVFERYLPAAASKPIGAWWGAGTYRSPTAPFRVTTASGNVTVSVNHQVNGARWNTLGTWVFPAGCYVVMADAIRVR